MSEAIKTHHHVHLYFHLENALRKSHWLVYSVIAN